MNIFFDVDGVLVRGFDINASMPAKWSETIEADLGLNKKVFETLLFAPRGDGAPPLFRSCLKASFI